MYEGDTRLSSIQLFISINIVSPSTHTQAKAVVFASTRNSMKFLETVSLIEVEHESNNASRPLVQETYANSQKEVSFER